MRGDLKMVKDKRCTNCGRFPFCNYDYNTCLIAYIKRFGNPQGPINDSVKDYWIKRENKEVKKCQN